MPYNVGSEEPITVKDLAGLVSECTGSSVSVAISGSPLPGLAPDRYVPATRRFTDLSGFNVLVTLKNSIERHLMWLRNRKALPSAPGEGALY